MVLQTIVSMPQNLQRAVALARLARERAIPPVSSFYVGAAVLTKEGKIYPGANVEEPAVNSTIHAETCAITGANAHGDRDVTDIVVCGDTPGGPVTPCLHCWQFICAYAAMLGHDIAIFCVTTSGDAAFVLNTNGSTPAALTWIEIGCDAESWRPK